MSFRHHEEDRHLVPRWHTFAMAQWLGVTKATSSDFSSADVPISFLEKILSWKTKREIAQASDLVGNALALGVRKDLDTLDAAKYLLQNSNRATPLMIDLASTYKILCEDRSFPTPDLALPQKNHSFYDKISSLKARVRLYPNNPILWMDLAFLYAAIAQNRAAERCVKVAISLNGSNRYLLRSAARFFLHFGNPEAALHYLRSSAAPKFDPWVLAAEIAISDVLDVGPQSVRQARQILENKEISNFHLSELAGALGTLEIKNGAQKKGRKLFEVALQDPTENTVAQATALQSELVSLQPIIQSKHPQNSFEAEAHVTFHNRDYLAALEASKKWFAYQPFTATPAVHGSYIASVAMGNFQEAVRLAKMGLQSSPDEFLLRNNLVFAYASSGKIQEASDEFARVQFHSLNENDQKVLSATAGVIEFRKGNLEDGRRLYEVAISYFRSLGDERSEINAKLFLAREEMLVSSGRSDALLLEVEKTATKLDAHELLAAARRIRDIADIKG